MRRAACRLTLFGLTTLVASNAMAEDCQPFSKRTWGCGSLFCVIVDALAVPVALVPRYDLSLGEHRIRHGLSWQAAIALYPQAGICHQWEHDIALELAYYPWSNPEGADPAWAMRTTWRTWFPSDRASSTAWTTRFGVGAGGFVGLGGAGPRLEVRGWLGSQAEQARTFGLFWSGAYEPDPIAKEHRGQFSMGLEMPVLL